MKIRSDFLRRAVRGVAVLLAVTAAACEDLPTGPAPADDMVRGIDVSRWQGVIDWNAVAGDEVGFAFIKATEGGDFTDPRFADNWAAAKQAGVVRGAYHFYRPQTSATKQAEHFLRTVPLAAGDLPPVLDVEVTDGASPDSIARGVRTWLAAVERATGRRPIIYTRASFWTPSVGAALSEYPLWVAHYRVAEPKLPAGWGNWAFWQHTDEGRTAGIAGNVDQNWFNGTRDQLRTFAATGAIPADR